MASKIFISAKDCPAPFIPPPRNRGAQPDSTDYSRIQAIRYGQILALDEPKFQLGDIVSYREGDKYKIAEIQLNRSNEFTGYYLITRGPESISVRENVISLITDKDYKPKDYVPRPKPEPDSIGQKIIKLRIRRFGKWGDWGFRPSVSTSEIGGATLLWNMRLQADCYPPKPRELAKEVLTSLNVQPEPWELPDVPGFLSRYAYTYTYYVGNERLTGYQTLKRGK